MNMNIYVMIYMNIYVHIYVINILYHINIFIHTITGLSKILNCRLQRKTTCSTYNVILLSAVTHLPAGCGSELNQNMHHTVHLYESFR